MSPLKHVLGEFSMTLRISNEHLSCHLIFELLLHPKHLYFAMVTCALSPGMASVHTSLLASDMSRYVPGKTREYGNQGAKNPVKS